MLSLSMILALVCIVCVTMNVLIDATEDVVIHLRYGNTTTVYNNVSFSEELFEELHTCMCKGRSVCYATYNISHPDPFRITEITPSDGNQTELPVYRCGHPEYSDKAYDGILCINTGLPENSYQTTQVTSFLYLKSVSDCSQTCVRIEWVHPDEGMFFPSDLQSSIHYCDANCNCSLTTSPLAFSTSSTLSPLISSRPSSAETTSVPTSKTTANRHCKSSKTSSTEIAAASTSKTTTNSPLISSRPSSAETAPVSTSKTTANLPSAQGLPAGSHSTSAGSKKPTAPTTSKTATTSPSPQGIPADSHSTSAGSKKTTAPTASSGHNNDAYEDDDKDDDVPVGIITGAAAGVVAVIIIIVVVVFWKRRKRESKLPDHPSQDTTTYYSSGSSKQQNTKHQSTELSYVNVTPPGVSNPYMSNYGQENTKANYYSEANEHGNENNGDDFGYSTAHDATPPRNTTQPKDEYEVVNKTWSAAKNTKHTTDAGIIKDMSMTEDVNNSTYTTPEANNVYSRLHENAQHMSNPYDSLLQLKMQPGSGNHLREPTHSLNPAITSESSPYSLARPISEAPNHKLRQHRL